MLLGGGPRLLSQAQARMHMGPPHREDALYPNAAASTPHSVDSSKVHDSHVARSNEITRREDSCAYCFQHEVEEHSPVRSDIHPRTQQGESRATASQAACPSGLIEFYLVPSTLTFQSAASSRTSSPGSVL